MIKNSEHVQSIIQHVYKNIFTVTHIKEKYEHLIGLTATDFKSVVMKTSTFGYHLQTTNFLNVHTLCEYIKNSSALIMANKDINIIHFWVCTCLANM